MKTFKKGGVHPPGYKLSAEVPVQVLPIPEMVVLPLLQHLGVPANPVVAKGDIVKTGQLIAKGEAFISANVHATVSGTVLKIDDIIGVSGYPQKAIFIKSEGDTWLDSIDRSPDLVRECNLTPAEIIRRVNEMGVVGMGGATFPSHVKLSIPKGKTAEYLLINGSECEPFLTADHRLMIERAEEMLVGIEIMMKATGVKRAIIGIENNKPDAIAKLRKLLPTFQGISVETLKEKYPQGSEKHLIKALVNREVPSGKLPIEVGCVVFNSGTALAIYEAVQKNKPLIDRIFTVTGKSLKEPANLLARIGTPISDIIKAVGGLPDDTGKVVKGGPMMGKALSSLDAPLIKGSSGILIISQKDSGRKATLNCIRCAHCVKKCPMGLEPYLLAVLAEKKRFEECEREKVMNCIECGSCLYICPSGRPLLDQIRVGKSYVGKMIRMRQK